MHKTIVSKWAGRFLVLTLWGALSCLSVAALAAEGDAPTLINPNVASVSMLMGLPGMNQDLAMAVVEFRESMGDLQSPEDLLQVTGFTRELLEKIAPLITVDAASTDCGC